MKKITVIFFVLPLVLTACWDSTEPQNLGVISAVGVDIGTDNNFRIYLQEVNPQPQGKTMQAGAGGGGGGPLLSLHTGEGTSILEAMDKMSQENNHHFTFSHVKAIVLSEELVQAKGIQPIIDYFARSFKVRENVWILIAEKGLLEQLLRVNAELLNKDIGSLIEQIISNGGDDTFITALRLRDFINMVESFGNDAYTSGIKLSGIGQANQNQGTQPSTFQPAGFNLNLGDTAVFHGSYLAGWLNREQAKGIRWINGKDNKGSVIVNLDDKTVTLRVIKIISKIKPVIADGRMKINIDIEVRSNISTSQADLDFRKKDSIQKIEQLQNEKIKEEVLITLEKTRQMRADIFGFGRRFYQEYPQFMGKLKGRWDEYYPTLEVAIKVNSKIGQIGTIGRPIKENSE